MFSKVGKEKEKLKRTKEMLFIHGIYTLLIIIILSVLPAIDWGDLYSTPRLNIKRFFVLIILFYLMYSLSPYGFTIFISMWLMLYILWAVAEPLALALEREKLKLTMIFKLLFFIIGSISYIGFSGYINEQYYLPNTPKDVYDIIKS